MKYIILVSHGTLACGIHSVLDMLLGREREDILHIGLVGDMSGDEYCREFTELIQNITAEDHILLMADIVGGSPLTNAIKVLSEGGLLAKTIAFAGVNLPIVLSAAMIKDELEMEDVRKRLIDESSVSIQEFCLHQETEEQEI
jgi:PTS system N-acetylgalactosamine-specific IIA component